MILLNNWLASLPFMSAERADYVISSFWPMLEAAILYTLPLAVISFFCGLLIEVIVAIVTGFMSSVYLYNSRYTDVSTNFYYFLWIT